MNNRELRIVKYIIHKIENTIFQKKQITNEIKDLQDEYNNNDKDIQFLTKSNYLEGIESQLAKDISNYEIDIKNILELGEY